MTDLSEVAAALPAYDVLTELGRGAFGIVWSGVHRQLERPVAVKQLPRALSASPTVRARFVTEAKVLAKLQFPHIVPVYDYVEHGELCLLVMEYLDGGTVAERVADREVSLEEACGAVITACAALHHAHEHGVLHRDVKPENLLLSSSGTLKVSDFGIAKVVGGGRSLATATGGPLGTPAYMAPEQARGDALTPACDVYAAAVVLYELLAGVLPYPDDEDWYVVLYRRVHEEPTPLRAVAPEVPAEVADVVMGALDRDPAHRPETAEEFAVALAEALTLTHGSDWSVRAATPLLAPGRILDACRPAPAARSRGVRPTPATPAIPPHTLRPAAPGRRLPASHHPVPGADVAVPLGRALLGQARTAQVSPVRGGPVLAHGPGPGAVVLAPAGTPVHAVTSGTIRGEPGLTRVVLRGRDEVTWTYEGVERGPLPAGATLVAGQFIGVVRERPSGSPGPTALTLTADDAAGAPVDVARVLVGLPDPEDLGPGDEEREGPPAGGRGLGPDPDDLDRQVASL